MKFAAPPAEVPVEPDRGQAREWVVSELSRREYQEARPGLIQRAVDWIQEKFQGVHPGFDSPVQITVTILAVLLVVAVGLALWRSGGIRRGHRRRPAAVLPAHVTTAADHRAAADRLAAAGQWGDAVLERFRAVARELGERALVPVFPGATAVEVAREGGTALPALAGDLRTAARHFDDICYGHLELTDERGREADGFLRRLDEQVRAARATAGLPRDNNTEQVTSR
ncbi:DUF4129 domain-containing protein [Kineosporia sp. NBRC 101731]|uniref:DUF4129 domain-containing protein n=1 Tax=Kineosporia sp. NBRC 101731 TaxID=3032199 RepID=UPI0024A16944|nr:DUF4129 domain-containing protein [Kineosporia sp. NBRC 101731]GLY28433.1 hypothetical protein Kisp02_17980 [Kineosporia sp. NBRC 101731]